MVILMIQIQFFHQKVSSVFSWKHWNSYKSGIYHPVEEEEKHFWEYCVETDDMKS